MDGPNASCWPCAHHDHEHCRGYTYPLETYRCACGCHQPAEREEGDRRG